MTDLDSDQLGVVEIQGPTPNPLHYLIEPARLRRNDGDTDGGSLPGIVVVDLGRRELHAATEVVEQRAKPPPFLLQRRTVRQPKIEAEGGSVHGIAPQDAPD